MRLLNRIACALILGSALAAPAFAVEPGAPETLISRMDAIGIEVAKRLEGSFRSASEYEIREQGALVEFYSDHDHEPIWVDEKGLKPKALKVIDELKRAADWGLNARDYTLPQDVMAVTAERPAVELAEAEMMMSRAVLAYARDARGGRLPPGSMSKVLDPTLDLPDPMAVLEQMAALDDPAPYLRDFHPKHPQFEALRQKLLAMRGGAEPDRQVVIPNGPTVRPGEKHDHIALLRKRLKVPVPERNGGPLFPETVMDSDLEMALREFQKSRGLSQDGILGPNTRRALNGGNAAPRNTVKTILANMERWRWIPVEKGLNVQVNVPEYTMRVFDGEKMIHSERVVVGKTSNPTPVFSDEMETVVFNPFWNVPNSIKKEEILPYLRRDSGGGGWFSSDRRPSILRRHNLHVKYNGRPVDASSIDWDRVDIRNYHIYQPPGGPNVLGVVKFMFPNKHDVYMHDTPTKSLFERPTRAYSHGCVRVRDPLKLAQILLGRDLGWSRGRIDAAVASGQNTHVPLNKKIPVHVTYFTARVTESGKIIYFSDLYGHDGKLAAALKL